MKDIINEYNEYLELVISDLISNFKGNALTNQSGLGAMSRDYNSKAVAKADEILNRKELSKSDVTELMPKLKEAQTLKHGKLVSKFL
jgi:hypothetical protein